MFVEKVYKMESIKDKLKNYSDDLRQESDICLECDSKC